MFAVSFVMALRKYMFYVFDQREKMLIMIDSRPVEEWCKDTPAMMYDWQTLVFLD